MVSKRAIVNSKMFKQQSNHPSKFVGMFKNYELSVVLTNKVKKISICTELNLKL